MHGTLRLTNEDDDDDDDDTPAVSLHSTLHQRQSNRKISEALYEVCRHVERMDADDRERERE